MENEGKIEDQGFDEVFDEAVGEQSEDEGQKEELAKKDEEDAKEAEAKKAEEEARSKEDETHEQRWKSLQGIYKHDKEQWETERSTLLSQLEEAKKVKAPETPEKKPSVSDTFIDGLSPEEKAEFEEYDSEFDVISRMEGKKREKAFKLLRKEFLDWKDEIVSQLKEASESGKVAVQKAESLEDLRYEEEHFNKIREKHSDFAKFRDDGSIEKWIETKPKYMQPRLKEIYSKGVTEDVIEFLDEFKKENGIDVEEGRQNVVLMDRKKMEKKEALKSVTSRRGAVNPSLANADDFDSAYEEALIKKTGG